MLSDGGAQRLFQARFAMKGHREAVLTVANALPRRQYTVNVLQCTLKLLTIIAPSRAVSKLKHIQNIGLKVVVLVRNPD